MDIMRVECENWFEKPFSALMSTLNFVSNVHRYGAGAGAIAKRICIDGDDPVWLIEIFY